MDNNNVVHGQPEPVQPWKDQKKYYQHHHAAGGGIYFLAFLGAAVYYIQHATSFWDGLLGVLKALVWPAMLAYELFKILHM